MSDRVLWWRGVARHRHLFERFANLNLLALTHHLELRGGVCRGIAWVKSRKGVTRFCPLAHGGRTRLPKRFIMFWVAGANEFIDEWDAQSGWARTKQPLLKMLRKIWAERLANADAEQAVLTAPPGPREIVPRRRRRRGRRARRVIVSPRA